MHNDLRIYRENLIIKSVLDEVSVTMCGNTVKLIALDNLERSSMAQDGRNKNR